MHIPGIKYVYITVSCLLVFWLLRYWSSTGKEEAEEHGNSVKIEMTSITPVLQAFLDFFQISLAFNMFSTLVLVEVKLSGN